MTKDATGPSVEFPVRDLVKQVAADLAPEEVRALAALDDLSDSEALRQLTARSERDERLGFGVGAALALTATVAWIGVDEAVRQIVKAATRSAGRSWHWWWPFSRREKPGEVTVIPPLTTEQLRLVHECVRKAAETSKLPTDRGSRIADSVVTRLVLGPQAPDEIEAKTETDPPTTS